MSFFRRDESVTFYTDPELFGTIPEPYPARHLMPEWFKHMPGKVNNEQKLNNSTIKRCMPHLDAMTIGWIIPLCADVEITTNEDASGVDYKWNFSRNVIENHSAEQINPPNGPAHPTSPKPPMKFLNPWYIKIPKGYSALFCPPLNRADPRFTCISGLVDDTYMGTGNIEMINFPFTFNQPNFTGIIKATTPLVQMILIKRDGVLSASKKATCQPLTEELAEMNRKTRMRRQTHESLYKNFLWQRK